MAAYNERRGGDGGERRGGEDRFSDRDARNSLRERGIEINKEARYTSLDGVRQRTLDGITRFQAQSGLNVVITGGTEPGHSSGHTDGYKLDIRSTDDVKTYIQNNFTPAKARSNGDPVYTDANGNEYCHEIHDPKNIHWDITYR